MVLTHLLRLNFITDIIKQQIEGSRLDVIQNELRVLLLGGRYRSINIIQMNCPRNYYVTLNADVISDITLIEMLTYTP